MALLDERGLPIVREIARIAHSVASPSVKLEGALEILFGAYGGGGPDFSGLLLSGWMRAQEDKHVRLTLAWHREQVRLCLEEILAEGLAQGTVRADLDPGAVAAVIMGAAEGCLLQTATDGGPITAGELARAVLRLAFTGA